MANKNRIKKNKKINKNEKKNIFLNFINLILGLFVWFSIALALFLFIIYLQLPSVSEIANNTDRIVNIRILDKNGEYLASYGDSYGKAVNINQLPKYVHGAFISIEDKRFYNHMGVDFKSIARAFYTNLISGRIKQGGSTITQQVAKNLFLTNERTLIRKIKELIYTIELETQFSKDQILSLYLNRVYMGNGQYGISASSKHYFGKSPDELTVWEASVLAGMMKAPSRYNPIYYPKKSANRAKIVLKKMVEMNFINKEQAKSYAKNTVKTIPQKNSRIIFFTEYARKQIFKILERVNQDIVVYTTLDLEKQKLAYKAIDAYKKSFIKQGAKQVAFVSMDISGAVRVMVGGIDDNSYFNRAVQAKRPVGSLFKSFVYANAMGRYSPNTKIRDSAFNIDGYKPKNYDKKEYGVVDLSFAFKKSLNLSTIKLSEKMGRQSTINFAQKIGITSKIEPVASMALGTSQHSLLEMVSAYGVFATGGHKVNPIVIDKIIDNKGNIIYSSIPISTQVIDSKIISKFNIMARQVIKDKKNGTGRKADIKGADIAGKTGTTQDYRDAWFIGYSSQVITGIWLGNDNNTKTKNVSGASYPALIWRHYMKNIVNPLFDGNLP